MLTNRRKEQSMLVLSSIRRRVLKGTNGRLTIPCDMICFVAEGAGDCRIGEVPFELRPGFSFYLKKGMPAQWKLDSGGADCYLLLLERVMLTKRRGSWSVTTALAEAESESEEAAWLPFAPGRLSIGNADAVLESVVQLCESGASNGSLQELLHRIIGSKREVAAEAAFGEMPGESGIEASIRFMQSHFRDKIKLETLADVAGLTPTSYSRSFKKQKGVTPIEYLTQLRIDASKPLLSKDNCSVKEISSIVGFGNEFHFSRTFKRSVGIAPTMFVKRKTLKVAIATGFGHDDNLRSLGIEPVAVINMYIDEKVENECNRGWLLEHKRTIEEAKPDLIIADCRHKPYYDLLKDAAQTAVLACSMDWRMLHLRIAELVGREREAQHNIGELERLAAFARAILGDRLRNETVCLMRMINKAIRLQGMANHPINELLYKELGLKPGSFVPLTEMNREFPAADLPPLDTDHLFVLQNALYRHDEADLQHLLHSPRWSAMKAVRNNQTRMVSNWVAQSWAPIGRKHIIEELLRFAIPSEATPIEIMAGMR
ncbi:helix-turn-helix domain-containing protein [Paenibacillus sp. NEAU-GSW1]|uniref:helix-turn-helix domain-containing protein n=1 Tax=Paenibacillus sp. NEAU-GSW1 TaxID=2682486 RepID=UPI0012E21F37|nr:AraC family transcriptional regulator [Paenibacillus sp. NEAU-GSW1]MUT67211.1 helix-turn-helix domain-containing protein [Paenibacillus sp. NEAU-GSW1]